MNQYLTVESEFGVFKLAPELSPLRETSPEAMQAEDQTFKAMNVKYEPDHSMDATIDALTEKITAKAG